MKAKEYDQLQRQLRQGKLCPCGQRAVRHTNAGWTCAGCIAKDRAIFATDRIRGTCGFPGALDYYRVVGI